MIDSTDIPLQKHNELSIKKEQQLNSSKKSVISINSTVETNPVSTVETNPVSTVETNTVSIPETAPISQAATKSIAITIQPSKQTIDTPISVNDISPYLAFVSIILIIVGWGVIYQNAKKLATRNETKSLIDDVVTIINSLDRLTIDYWLSGRKNRLETDEFILLTSAKLQTLSSRLDIVEKRNIDISCVDLSIISSHMTLNCEEVDRRKPEENRIQLQLFLEESNNSVINLYNEFQKCYTPSFGLFKNEKKSS